MEDVSRRTERDLCAITGDVESLSIENNNLPRELLPVESVGNNNDVEEYTSLPLVLGRDKHHQEHMSKRTAWMQPTEADGNCNVISQDVPESLQNDSNILVCCDDQQQTISQPSYRYSVQIKQRGDDTELVEPPDMHVCMDAGADDDIPEYTDHEGIDRHEIHIGDVDFTEQSLQTEPCQHKSDGSQEGQVSPEDGSQGQVSPEDGSEGQVSPADGSQGQVSPEDGSEGQDDDVISEESLLESAAMLQSHVVMLDGDASPGATMSVEGGDGRQSAEMFRKVMLDQVQQQLEDLDRELKMHLVKSEQCLLLNRSKLSRYMEQAEAVFSEDVADMEGAACGQQEDDLLLPLPKGNFSLKDLLDSDSDSSQQGEGEREASAATGSYWRQGEGEREASPATGGYWREGEGEACPATGSYWRQGEGEREASPAAGGYWRQVEIEASCAANGYLREGEREASPAAGGYWREELVFANKIQELERAVEERVTAIRPPEDVDEEGAEDVTGFHHLPAELVVRILAYLTPQELCERVAPVCRAWYRHAHDPLLWRELDLDFTHDVQAVDLCAMIRRAPLLKVLVMRGRNELTITEVSVFVKHCGMLQQLDMGFCKVLDLTMLHIIVDNCPQLEEVNVEGCDSIRDSCLMVLSRLSRLKVLNLSHCTSVTDEGVCHLVRNCPGLVSLNIDGIAWITDSAVQDLAACCPSMRQLYLDGDELTDASISAVTDSCAQLELLDISFCEGVTDLSVHNIPRLQHLEHLRLKRGMQLTTAVMLHLFRGETLAGLTYLNLTECTAVNNGAVERITKCCPHLKELYLCWCWDITEEGLEHIINNLSKLHHLDVTGQDKITGACLTSLPSTLPLLTFLNLQQCNRVQDEVLSTLVATVTDLTIVDYYGNHVPPLLAPFH